MRSEIPRWVISALSLWGRQKRRVWVGKDWHGNVDGYTQSLLGRIRDEQILAKGVSKLVHGEDCGRPPVQYWPEVFWGVGLEVQRAIYGMNGVPYCVLHLHYVWPPEWEVPITTRAEALGIKKPDYWRELENGETWTHARLDPSCTEIVEQIIRKALQNPTHAVKKPQTRPYCPSAILNLEALGRSKVSLKRA